MVGGVTLTDESRMKDKRRRRKAMGITPAMLEDLAAGRTNFKELGRMLGCTGPAVTGHRTSAL